MRPGRRWGEGLPRSPRFIARFKGAVREGGQSGLGKEGGEGKETRREEGKRYGMGWDFAPLQKFLWAPMHASRGKFISCQRPLCKCPQACQTFVWGPALARMAQIWAAHGTWGKVPGALWACWQDQGRSQVCIRWEICTKHTHTQQDCYFYLETN